MMAENKGLMNDPDKLFSFISMAIQLRRAS
jgi:hypothetical protein